MKPQKVTVGQTIEYIDSFGRSTWNKIGVEYLLEDNDELQNTIDVGMSEVKQAHERYMPDKPTPEPIKPPTNKIKPDKSIRQKYAHAVINDDLVMVAQLESMYEF